MQHAFSIFVLIFCYACLIFIVGCYAAFFRVVHKIQRQDRERQASAAEASLGNRKFSEASLSPAVLCELASLDRKKRHRQLLKRHKHVIVIGMVIGIYALYLGTYSTVQVFHIASGVLKGGSSGDFSRDVKIRLVVQVLFGIHAVLQPLCYLRMSDLRRYLWELLRIKHIKGCRKHRQRAGSSLMLPNTPLMVENSSVTLCVHDRQKRDSELNNVYVANTNGSIAAIGRGGTSL